MKTKWVSLMAFSLMLLVSQVAFAQYTGGSYDGYGMGTSAADSSLPIELSSFTAAASVDGVTLKWRTETEVNNLGFGVYRSEGTAGEDASSSGNYTKIGFVEGAGNSNLLRDYQFVDDDAEVGKTYFYYLEDVDIYGVKNKNEIIKVAVVVVLDKALRVIPMEFRLLQNFPNPFNPETWLPYQLASDAIVLVGIYDMKGQLVRQLDLGEQKAGQYVYKGKAAYWDGKDQTGEPVSSGLYFYMLKAGDFQATKRMLIVK